MASIVRPMGIRLVRSGLLTAGVLAVGLSGLGACGSPGEGAGESKPGSSKARTTPATPKPSATTKPPDPARAPASVQPGPGNHKLSLQRPEGERTYIVHAPPGYKPGLPVVFAFHFYPGAGDQLQQMIGLDAKADKENFLTVYPDGQNGGFNALICCGENDDVGLVKELVASLEKDWGADPSRVYATGISNGGDLVYKLAVEIPDTFAAIAPVSGGFIGDKPADSAYAPKSRTSVITFIGGQDRYATQFTDGLAAWQQRLKCKVTPAKPVGKSGKVKLSTGKCADSSDVAAYTMPSEGHAWPGAKAGIGPASPDAPVNATDLLWEFFEAHPKK